MACAVSSTFSPIRYLPRSTSADGLNAAFATSSRRWSSPRWSIERRAAAIRRLRIRGIVDPFFGQVAAERGANVAIAALRAPAGETRDDEQHRHDDQGRDERPDMRREREEDRTSTSLKSSH